MTIQTNTGNNFSNVLKSDHSNITTKLDLHVDVKHMADRDISVTDILGYEEGVDEEEKPKKLKSLRDH